MSLLFLLLHQRALQDHRLLTAEEIEAESNSIWNRKGRIPLWTWLSDAPVADSKQRLKMLGNAVMPRCGRLALHLMLHQHQKLIYNHLSYLVCTLQFLDHVSWKNVHVGADGLQR